MIEFALVRLGKDSVATIKELAAMTQAPPSAVSVSITCKQVPDLAPRTFVLIWLGSDNSKGQPTEWDQGLRAIGRFVARSGGPGYNDDWQVQLEVGVVLGHSIQRREFLGAAATAYYWFSEMPVVGLNTFSNQTVQQVRAGESHQDPRALLYAIEAVAPGSRAEIERVYPELGPLFNYSPPPSGRHAPGHSPATGDTEQESNQPTEPMPTTLPADWILSLASKGFVLATGASGTGKTRTARDIARTLDYSLGPEYAKTAQATRPANCLALVPVGADWTDAVPLLGFKNPFGVSSDGSAATAEWEVPVALRLLLRATMRPDQPHFLVLDEMNLSHVERYFGPFLSLLEANRGLDSQNKLQLLDPSAVALVANTLKRGDLYPLELEAAEELADSGRGLVLPDNVFFVGTVNIDETTYMFSPKVLDRAHVLETSLPNPKDYLGGAAEVPGSVVEVELAKKLLASGIVRRRTGYWERQTPVAVVRDAAAQAGFDPSDALIGLERTLGGLHKLLTPVGFGFGQRTINEVYAFIATYIDAGRPDLLSTSTSAGWQVAIDLAVLQKLLPKLNGNRRLLAEALRAIEAFLRSEPASFVMGGDTIDAASFQLGFALPRSASKIRAMGLRLEATGHTTFVQ